MESRPPDTYRLKGGQIIDGSGNFRSTGQGKEVPLEMREASNKSEPPESSTIEQLDQEPDYVEKLTMTPLPVDVMQQITDQLASEQNDDVSTEFKRDLIHEMQKLLAEIRKVAHAGDNITFDDLVWEATERTGHNNKINLEDIIHNPSFVAETKAIDEVTDQFAQLFDQHPTLEYIGDDIDAYTIHPDVHGYERERAHSHPDRDFHGEGYGKDGRWIAERRGESTVWVARGQKQDEAREAHIAASRATIDQLWNNTQEEAETALVPQLSLEEKARLLDKIPDDKRERFRFSKDNFVEVKADKIPLFAAFLEKEIINMAARVPQGSRYPDTVAAVLGSSGEALGFLYTLLHAQQDGANLTPVELLRQPFSKIARRFGIEVKAVIPDYDNRFSSQEDRHL